MTFDILRLTPLFCLLLLFLAAPPAHADGPTFEDPRMFGTGDDMTTSVVVGDVDGDGDLDMATGNQAQQSAVYLNDGQGHFDWSGAARPFGAATDYISGVALGDVDGDGDLDLAASNHRLYLNDGAGHFWTDAIDCTNPPASGRCFGSDLDLVVSMVLGDMNGDGALDIVANTGHIYLNDGAGHFHTGSVNCASLPANVRCFPQAARMAIGDVNGDGSLDLVINVPSGQSAVYINDGDSRFPVTSTFGVADWLLSITVGDMDGSGSLDLVTGGSDLDVVYFNDGLGHFPLVTDTLNCASPPTRTACFGAEWDTATHGLAVGDLDSDGDLDILAGESQSTHDAVYLNDGGGHFPITATFGTGGDETISVAVADMDGNGSLDLVTANDGHRNVVYLNDGGGDFAAGSARVFGGNLSLYSLAMGDVDGDSSLDLIAAEDGVVYLNDGAGNFYAGEIWGMGERDCGTLPDHVRCFPQNQITDYTRVRVGDVDGDSDLDIIAHNVQGPGLVLQNAVFLNDGQGHFYTGTLDCQMTGFIRCFGVDHTADGLAVGDVDGDGDLDIVLPGVIYLNDGRGYFASGSNCNDPAGSTRCFGNATRTDELAVGDVDRDGDLDIVAGAFYGQSMIYLNDGVAHFYYTSDSANSNVPCSALPNNARCFGGSQETITSLALGDLNGDGNLDIVAGSLWGFAKLYLNDGGGRFDRSSAVRYFGSGLDTTYSLALDDMDGDGDLDIVVGATGQSGIYVNDGSGQFGWFTPVRELGANETWIVAVAAGDLDNDGVPDLATGGYFWRSGGGRNEIHLNRSRRPRRTANTPPTVAIAHPGGTPSAGLYSSAEILEGNVPITYTLFDVEGEPVGRVAATYSPDGGGHWLPAMPTTDTVTTDLPTGSSQPLAHRFSWDTYASGFFGQSDNVVFRIEAYPSLRPHTQTVPSASWPYVAADTFPFRLRGTQVRVLSNTLPVVGALVYRLPAGQSHGAELISDEGGLPLRTDQYGYLPGHGELRAGDRLVALMSQDLSESFESNFPPAGWASYRTGAIEGRGWQVGQSGTPGSQGGAHSGKRYTWHDEVGGTGQTVDWLVTPRLSVGAGDQLSFWERTTKWSEGQNTIWLTSDSDPDPRLSDYVQIGAGRVVTGWAQQVIDLAAYSGQSVYIAFRHGTGLWGLAEEWYLDDVALGPSGQGASGLGMASGARLYYTNATPTGTGLDAHTIIAPGVQTLAVSPDHPLVLFSLDVSLQWDARSDGFLSQLEFDLQRTSELLYDWTNGQAALGQVRVYHERQNWNEADVQIYATNRLRPNAAQGGIVQELITDPLTSAVTYTPGQVRMGAVWNRYGDPGGSLGEDWPRTLAHELGHYALFLDDNYVGLDAQGLLVPVEGCTGAMADPYRGDYPYDEFHASAGWLPACASTLSNRATGRSDWTTITTFYPWLSEAAANTGPSVLPLAVTRVQVVEPVSPSIALVDPTFYLVQAAQPVRPGSSARTFLFQDDWLLDLGKPTQDRVLARGARPGDRLCVLEPDASRLGCETIAEHDRELSLTSLNGWQPDLIISPVSSRTIAITVSAVPAGLPLQARLFPMNGPAGAPITLTWGGGTYRGSFVAETIPLAGYVYIWVAEPEPRRESITDYSLGGNPGRIGGFCAPARSRFAPGASADGQVMVFGDLNFGEWQFFALQAATAIPSPPPWATVVGHAYRLLSSPGAPDLSGASISFMYMGSEVPSGEESWLHVYKWDGTRWQQLPTTLDTTYNTASAPLSGAGLPAASEARLYALMSSLEIPLPYTGWNLISYPVQGSRPVTEALVSISGIYTAVYGHEPNRTPTPWLVYAPRVPTYVVSLHRLEFGKGYWINTSQAITLQLKGSASLQVADSFPSVPPATYYGQVQAASGFAPAAGMTVTAWIDGHLCGQGQTLALGQQTVYVVSVEADWAEAAGCGAPGRTVSFRVGTQMMEPAAAWDNGNLWELPLRPAAWKVYLPLIIKQE